MRAHACVPACLCLRACLRLRACVRTWPPLPAGLAGRGAAFLQRLHVHIKTRQAEHEREKRKSTKPLEAYTKAWPYDIREMKKFFKKSGQVEFLKKTLMNWIIIQEVPLIKTHHKKKEEKTHAVESYMYNL